MYEFKHFTTTDKKKLIDLFKSTFSDSEGADEGQLIAELVNEMITTSTSDELDGYVIESDDIIGCVLFSRFNLPNNKKAYILSPMAIATNHQKKGLGQALIKHGINELKAKNVEILLTYGDPEYYSKVGFECITGCMIQPPQPLSYPNGWLAQSLNNKSLKPMPGKTSCISPLNDPVYW